MPGTSAAPSPTSSFASDIVDAVAVPAAPWAIRSASPTTGTIGAAISSSSTMRAS